MKFANVQDLCEKYMQLYYDKLIKTAAKKNKSVRAITSEHNTSNINISHQTVWRGLQREGYFTHRKLQKIIIFFNNTNRNVWNVKWIISGGKRHDLQFHVLIKKKIILDGSNGIQYYWQDQCRQSQQFYSRHSGGQSIMVCTGISISGKLELCFVPCSMNSEVYKDVLEIYLLLFAYCNYETARKALCLCWITHQFIPSFILRSDLKHSDINFIGWPALPTNCNTIESIWGTPLRAFYSAGKQYISAEELKGEIELK